MREIVLDTETTGLSARDGDRIVDIGCIELSNRIPTGRTFQTYINPERDMPEQARRIHGLSTEFLADKPVFAAIAADFLAFVGDDPLVIHNAAFDMSFINAELEHCGRPPLTRNPVIDTVELARRRFPGQIYKLDALCARFGIDNSARSKHGALLDADLLAQVYLELTGGRQAGMDFATLPEAGPVTSDAAVPASMPDDGSVVAAVTPKAPTTRVREPDAAELRAHRIFLEKITAPIWNG